MLFHESIQTRINTNCAVFAEWKQKHKINSRTNVKDSENSIPLTHLVLFSVKSSLRKTSQTESASLAVLWLPISSLRDENWEKLQNLLITNYSQITKNVEYFKSCRLHLSVSFKLLCRAERKFRCRRDEEFDHFCYYTLRDPVCNLSGSNATRIWSMCWGGICTEWVDSWWVVNIALDTSSNCDVT